MPIIVTPKSTVRRFIFQPATAILEKPTVEATSIVWRTAPKNKANTVIMRGSLN